jgi:methionyl-tRNA synthetase
MKNKKYLTTPLYYVNASPHIGHAYTTVITDCFARFYKQLGQEVFFLTGTDEHGEKIKKASVADNVEIKDFVDNKAGIFKELWQLLDIDYDFFIRTTDKKHRLTVQKVINTLYEKGDIYKSQYKGFYCTPCESFWTESQIREAAGNCPDCQRRVEQIVEDNYFFKLSKYEKWLKDYLKNNPTFIKPRVRYNEVLGFLNNNQLEDLCISRPRKRLSWGVEFPLDKDYVVYVWFDALLNYVSALDFDGDKDFFAQWWPADMQFIGKDILRHHAIFWPIMLKALEVELPKTIFAHGWWKVEQQKISKSRGNIVDPFKIISQIGSDAFRYFLLRDVSLGLDGNYNWSGIVNRLNSDLANDLGNLVFRVLTMSEKYFSGKVSVEDVKAKEQFYFLKMLNDSSLKNNYLEAMQRFEPSEALSCVWSFINVMNKSIEEIKPWVLRRENKIEQLQKFIWSLLVGINNVTAFIYPFMPKAARAISQQLGAEIPKITELSQLKTFNINKQAPLFPRIDVD